MKKTFVGAILAFSSFAFIVLSLSASGYGFVAGSLGFTAGLGLIAADLPGENTN